MYELLDFVEIRTPKEILDLKLNQEQVQELTDNIMTRKKGLRIVFDMSHSAKVINNRIYQPWAQRATVNDWSEPPKPILLHHDRMSDPIGRFESVEIIDLRDEAIAYLGSEDKYNEIVAAYETRDAEVIGRIMNKFKLANDKEWPGLTKMRGTAIINDREAIEKFLDGRYLQFSNGASTDAIHCTTCGTHIKDWFSMCDHPPGSTDEDGVVALWLTDSYKPKESSVVNDPADPKAMLVHMSMSDAQDLNDEDQEKFISISQAEASSLFTITDAELDFNPMEFKDEHIRGLKDEIVARDTQIAELEAKVAALEAAPQLFSDESEPCESSLPWKALDIALRSSLEVRDAADIPAQAFIGPDNQFPVYDKETYEKALELVDGIEDEALKVALDKRGAILGLVKPEVTDSQELQDLKEDYAAALAVQKTLIKDKENLETSYNELVDKVVSKLSTLPVAKNVELSDKESLEKLDILLDMFDNQNNTELPEQIPDPTVSDNNDPLPSDSLNFFEKQVLKKFKDALEEHEPEVAKQLVLDYAITEGYVSADFDPEKYLN